MGVSFRVLGPVSAVEGTGQALPLRGPRHRSVLARLLVARGRAVPMRTLVADLWEDPPDGAAGAVQTFVGALRRGLEPKREPRTPSRLIVTEGGGYAVRVGPEDAMDAWAFEAAVAAAADAAPTAAVALLGDALASWRGPALADLADLPWVDAERARLAELRLGAVESLAEAYLTLGETRRVVPDLEAHVTTHPWREAGWRLLGVALYRNERQTEALDVVRRARHLLATELGLDPGPRLAALERDILAQARHLDGAAASTGLWAEAAAAFERVTPADSSTRLQSTVALLGDLAVTGGAGLEAARTQRLATVDAAEGLDDPELTASVIGSFEVPGIWARSDDPDQAARIVAAARRAERRLPADAVGLRARLLATIALESRGTGDPGAVTAADEAVRLARELGDPRMLALALSGSYMQRFATTGLARERDALGRELIELSTRHGLSTFRIMGGLIRMHGLSALGRFDEAAVHAHDLDALAIRHGRPAVTVFTTWFRAVRADAEGGSIAPVEDAYRHAADQLRGSGMPGVEGGALALALLGARLTRGLEPPVVAPGEWGPHLPWVLPHLHLAQGRTSDAAAALRAAPPPPTDGLAEAMWSLLGDAALRLGDRSRIRDALRSLEPARAEIAGAGSGMLALWPVARLGERLEAAARG